MAANTSSSVSLLERLLRDYSPEVEAAAAANPGLPQATLAMWQLARGGAGSGSGGGCG